ncbi:mycofactocin-coupled SDR family oxidoreductase [Rhodococcus opacus]|uniref:mycofactocin-coupled SDR family oxidoreductase n=1 Tax=Rhodococcus opacus TaxID=37919 RepID=UPI0024769CBD|nr:mycofactocin-coupled SDR family oxidoreductase [Rhodococcus opacus]MDH6291977.1 SDR family mycofactocin-dependent oxidoreductase [Rhodococcus opacus]
MGLLDNMVVLISGAARGQGRSHAVRLAEEGADIVGFDICSDIDPLSYPMATSEDLIETSRLVEKAGRRMLAIEADVRDRAQVQSVVDAGVAEFGRLDSVIANAGIAPTLGANVDEVKLWSELIAVNLTGVFHTVRAAAPAIVAGERGGSIVIISSTAGLKGTAFYGQGEGYAASKHGVVGLMRCFAHEFAPHRIRVNTIHPTGVETPMIQNEAMEQAFRENPDLLENVTNLIDVPWVQSSDVSEAVLWLVSENARYVTGTTLPVDAGLCVK